MGIYADDVAEFASLERDEDRDQAPLGERLHGLATNLDVESVAEVREIRERRESDL